MAKKIIIGILALLLGLVGGYVIGNYFPYAELKKKLPPKLFRSVLKISKWEINMLKFKLLIKKDFVKYDI